MSAAAPRMAEFASPADYPVGEPHPERAPWPGEFHTLEGADIFVRTTPSKNPEAEPALYVHGLGGASTNFTDLADLLSPWFDGRSLDLAGFGQSGPPLADDYRLHKHAAIVVAYLETSGRGPVHLVGNSMGGAICIEVATTRPDLVKTLTLISPAVSDFRIRKGSALLMPLLLVPGLGSQALSRIDRSTPERRAQAVIKLCFAHPERVPPNRLAEAAADIGARRKLPWAHDALLRSFRSLVRGYLAMGERSAWRQMAEIKAPTLVVWGARDKLVHVSNAPRVASVIADSTLLVLNDVGHTAQLEDARSTARAILSLYQRANDGRDPNRVGA
ncbi:alpha/beta fold hydrolase [Jatrophihabitans sp. DSM 45814]